ncbi:MAG: OsmC family protein [Pseudomonadota bacterium]|jgi:organic hydroperoxide reductase OsmC/OhrA|nr:OsmC family protein [Pseudomonadota bacterium]MBU2252368.1 OsmC family protein [Pseudomonadota bacterium]
MMGTLAALLAGKKIPTPEDRYWADVKGDIENVDNVLKITRIKVTYHLKTPNDKVEEAREAFSSYIKRCPAAQSVIGCIRIEDDLVIEAM